MKANYTLHSLELSEYTRILSGRSGIDACMYIDESASFERWKHPLWVIVSDGDPYCDNWVAVSVSANPQIATAGNQSSDKDCQIKSINECLEFVSKFHLILTDIATEMTDSSIIYDILDNHRWQDLTQNDILNLQKQLTPEYILEEQTSESDHIYRLTDLDELMEYMWLKPKDTSLDYDIFVDDGEAYKRGNHPLLLFARNGKGRACSEFIPITVSAEPKILDNSINIRIPDSALSGITSFIKGNEKLLRQMAGGNMDPNKFVSQLKLPN